MDKLWAPWRIGYITTAKQQKGCLFCRVRNEKNDKGNLLLFRFTHVFIILNKFPYNNGHVMIVPYRHVKDLEKLRNEEILDLFSAINRAQKALKETLKPDGFNIGMNIGSTAGAGIPAHAHVHIVPRWKEDTNFMPVLFDTKIISQSLKELYGQLYKRI